MKAGPLIYVAALALGQLESTFAAPSPGSDVAARHDHHHDLHASHKAEESTMSTTSDSSSSSSTQRPTPPNTHARHGGHHQAQLELNETDVHYWHHFPPSYLAADFRLSKDQVIFGEELDETWVPEDEGGHRTLAFAHAGSFVLAYFGFLPIGKYALLHVHTSLPMQVVAKTTSTPLSVIRHCAISLIKCGGGNRHLSGPIRLIQLDHITSSSVMLLREDAHHSQLWLCERPITLLTIWPTSHSCLSQPSPGCSSSVIERPLRIGKPH